MAQRVDADYIEPSSTTARHRRAIGREPFSSAAAALLVTMLDWMRPRTPPRRMLAEALGVSSSWNEALGVNRLRQHLLWTLACKAASLR